MWLSGLQSIVVLAGLHVAQCDLVVPLCCPFGQEVEGMDTVDGVDRIYCNATVDPFAEKFEPIGNLSSIHHPLTCPTITNFDDDYEWDNLTFAEHVGMILSEPEGDGVCFDFTNDTVVLYSCIDDPTIPQKPEVNWKLTVTTGLSVVLLIITAVMYSTVKPLRTNSHSPYIVAHNLSLAMSYVSRICLQFITISEEAPECLSIAFILQFSSMAAFFWMSAMCLDIHLTIRRMLPTTGERSPFNKKFLLLSLYAWGIPLLFSTAAVIFEFTDVVPSNSPFKPHVARSNFSCFFTGLSRWYLYKIPIAVSVVLSALIFVATAVVLVQHKRAMASIQVDSRFKNDKRCYILYLKLFVIMGIGWGLGWTVDVTIKYVLVVTQSTAPPYFSYIYKAMDLIFCLQGIFIFILFVCKKRTILILLEQFPSIRFLKFSSSMTDGRKSCDSSSFAGDPGMSSAASKETVL